MRNATRAISKTVSTVERKFVNYEFTEAVVLPLSNAYTGNVPLQQNQRCYFGANNSLKGKRIVGVQMIVDNGTIPYNDILILTEGSMPFFTLTIVNTDGEEQIKDYPLADLLRHSAGGNGNFGKTRIFNVLHDIEKSYVIKTNPAAVAVNVGLLFNFYTTSW